jgi:propanediol dehydratase large subunit
MFTEDMIEKVQQASTLIEENVALNSKDLESLASELGKSLATLTVISLYAAWAFTDEQLKQLNLKREEIYADVTHTSEAVKTLMRHYEDHFRKEIEADTLEALIRYKDNSIN